MRARARRRARPAAGLAVGALITVVIGAASAQSAVAQGTVPARSAPLGAPMRPFDTTAYAVIETMRGELGRLRGAQVSFYLANHRYASTTAELDFVPTHGTVIVISEADARAYRATATNAALAGAEIELYEPAPPPGAAEPAVAVDTAGTAPVTRPAPDAPRARPDPP